jgi:hypothetical protein
MNTDDYVIWFTVGEDLGHPAFHLSPQAGSFPGKTTYGTGDLRSPSLSPKVIHLR